MLCRSHFGLFFHQTPIRYTGTPLKMMAKPMAHSFGVIQKETAMRKLHARTKKMGNSKLTCVGEHKEDQAR